MFKTTRESINDCFLVETSTMQTETNYFQYLAIKLIKVYQKVYNFLFFIWRSHILWYIIIVVVADQSLTSSGNLSSKVLLYVTLKTNDVTIWLTISIRKTYQLKLLRLAFIWYHDDMWVFKYNILNCWKLYISSLYTATAHAAVN